MNIFLYIVLSAATIALPMRSAADDKSEKGAAAAFKKGIDYYKSGNLEEAVKSFRRANELHPSWKLQFNIGQCEAGLRRFGQAIDAFEQYLAEGGDEVPLERRDEVLRELDRLRRMVGTISVKGESGIDILVDNIKRGNTSVQAAIKVTAGVEHEVAFMKGNKTIGKVKLVVSGGEIVELPVDPKASSTVKVAPPPPPLPPPTPQPAPTTASSPQKPVVNVPPPAQAYVNMRQLKDAIRQGRITKAEYSSHQAEIRKKRDAELNALRTDLRARKITERDYKNRAVEIKKKYEGD